MIMMNQRYGKRVNIVHHDLKAELNPLIRSDIGEVDAVIHLVQGHTLIAVLTILWSLYWTMKLELVIY